MSHFFWHTFDTGGVQFTNMQVGGSLNISGGVFPGSLTVAQYAGDVTVSGGPSSMSVPNPGVDSSLTFIGSGWTFAGIPLTFVGNEADLTDIGFGSLQGTLADGTPFQVVLGGTGFGIGYPKVTVVDTTLPSNMPPTAVAGPDQSARVDDMIFLDGSNSYDDNTPSNDLSYHWSFVSKPAGSSTDLTGEDTATPSFIADSEGTFKVGLIVTDTGGLSSTKDEVEISTDNLAPTADAGDDQLTIIGYPVELKGSNSSDPEGDALAFAWTITSAPFGSTAVLSNSTTKFPNIIPDLEGVYEITLVVSDFIGPGVPDTVVVTVTTADDFAEIQIVAVDEIVSVLDASLGEVTNTGNQNAFENFLTQAMVALQNDDTAEAINKIKKGIARTDGCFLRGEPDGNGKGRDWRTSCSAQTEVYNLLTTALNALTP